jgi:signal transduction histidine kinase
LNSRTADRERPCPPPAGGGDQAASPKTPARSADRDERAYRMLVDDMIEGFALHEIVCGPDGRPIDYRFLQANAAFESQTGLRAEDIVGRTARDILPDLEDAWIERFARVALTGEADAFILGAASLRRVFRVRAHSPARGRVAAVLLDISDCLTQAELAANDDLRAANAELRRINAELAEANAAKNAFIAEMSHELRTPLNSVIGYSGVLLQGLAGTLNEEQAKQLSMIRASGDHLLELINQVLDVAKIEAGDSDIALAPVDVDALVGSVLDSVALLAATKGLTLTSEIDADVGSIVSNFVRLDQVLLNLVGNAVKYTDKGSVRVRVSCEAGEAVFAVTDTGSGIPRDELPRIFDDFYQVERGDFEGPRGTGLGLSVSRTLVEALGGTIHVRSRLGRGSTFTVRIPCSECAE